MTPHRPGTAAARTAWQAGDVDRAARLAAEAGDEQLVILTDLVRGRLAEAPSPGMLQILRLRLKRQGTGVVALVASVVSRSRPDALQDPLTWPRDLAWSRSRRAG
jgi:hypothetical protein